MKSSVVNKFFDSDTKKLEDWVWEKDLGTPTPFESLISHFPKKSQTALMLEDGAKLVDGDRNKQHGARHQNFSLIAKFWEVLFDIPIPAWKVARAMELVKISRDMNGSPSPDNALDGAVYSAMSWELRGGDNGC